MPCPICGTIVDEYDLPLILRDTRDNWQELIIDRYYIASFTICRDDDGESFFGHIMADENRGIE